MTQLEIVRLARKAQLERWSIEVDYLNNNPDNKYAEARADRAWDKVKELDEMLVELEKAEA